MDTCCKFPRAAFFCRFSIVALCVAAVVSCSDDSESTGSSAPLMPGASDTAMGGTPVMGSAGVPNMGGAGGSPLATDSADLAGAGGRDMGSAGALNIEGAGGSLLVDAGVFGSEGGGGSLLADAGLEVETATAADSGVVAEARLIALTFDDGPDNVLTGAVLDRLEFHQVPASFFVVGQNVNAGTQAIMNRAVSLGCEFENHSAGFDSLAGLSAQAVLDSVNATNTAVTELGFDSPQFFRPPNLATDANMFEVIDLPFVRGIVAGDFPAQFGGNPTVEAVSQAVLSAAQDGSIVLLHDVQPQLDPQPTPDALDIIIPALQAEGFEFVTLRQLFERRGGNPNAFQNDFVDSLPPSN